MKGMKNLCFKKTNKTKQILSNFELIKNKEKNYFLLNKLKISNNNCISSTQNISNVIKLFK